mmetsp:Transcript_31658/g.76823  ORF Transcript_31658/g.76823 Transcript_31658/m.76823 type:complete len:223 (-) Transcript_31658:637-1305(-)
MAVPSAPTRPHRNRRQPQRQRQHQRQHQRLYHGCSYLSFVVLFGLLFTSWFHEDDYGKAFSLSSSLLRPNPNPNINTIMRIGSSSRFMGSRMVFIIPNSNSNSDSRTNFGISTSNNNINLVMRDRSSSYWFNVGDTVQVVADDVVKSGIGNLQGFQGTVVETWEKCDVDPTCCCAEQVDVNMAVRVEFENEVNNKEVDGDDHENDDDESFQYYFAESELEKV